MDLGTQWQSSLAEWACLQWEFRRCVLISFIWEELLSTEAVETGNVKPIEAYPFCVHLGGYHSYLYCFFIIQGESKLIFPVEVEQNLNWLLSIRRKLGRIVTGNVTRKKYGQCWYNIMSYKPAWNVFLKEGYKWCLLEWVDLVCTNNFPSLLLKVILGIQKFQNPVCCWSNGIIQCVENCIDEKRSWTNKLFCLKTFAELSH